MTWLVVQEHIKALQQVRGQTYNAQVILALEKPVRDDDDVLSPAVHMGDRDLGPV